MRRRLVTLGLCLLGGAAINVLVAWGLAMWGGFSSWWIEHNPDEPMIAGTGYSTHPAWDVRTLVVRRGLGTRSVLITEMPWLGSRLGMMSGSRNRSVQIIETGWPMRSMRMHGGLDSHPPGDGTTRVWRSGITFDPDADGTGLYSMTGRLPVRPELLGFTANTVFYGTAAWLVVLGPFAMRRMRRRRYGRCLKCGYQLDDLPTCPECGTPSIAKAPEPAP